jgi:hypothetical protein
MRLFDNLNQEENVMAKHLVIPRMCWIVVGPNVWGKGDTEEEAMKKCKEEYGGPLDSMSCCEWNREGVF